MVITIASILRAWLSRESALVSGRCAVAVVGVEFWSWVCKGGKRSDSSNVLERVGYWYCGRWEMGDCWGRGPMEPVRDSMPGPGRGCCL
jgi:hypothetical protein